MTPEQQKRANAIQQLIRMGWNPPRPDDRQTARIVDDIVGCNDRYGTLALTEKERHVLSLFASGSSAPEIAHECRVTEDTVRARLKNIRAKLGARNSAHAVALAVTDGLIDLREAA